MKHHICLLIVAVFLTASTGCSMVDSGQSAMKEFTRSFRPRPFDEPAGLADEEDEWGFVGDEGRAGMDRERDPDRWWQNLIMSPQARQIERNLGID